MATNRSVIIILLLAMTLLLVLPASAAKVSDIRYASEVYTESEEFIPTEISVPPAGVLDTGIVDSIKIGTTPTQEFQRYALVSMPESGIDISFTLDSDGVTYNSDLKGLIVHQDDVVVTNGILTSGRIRVEGDIPPKTAPDKSIRIIELEEVPGSVNNLFVVKTTTKERGIARNTIYLLNKKVLAGGSDEIKTDLQNAMTSYNAGNYAQAIIYADAGLKASSMQAQGSYLNIAAILMGILIGGAVFGFLGWHFGTKNGVGRATRHDLLKIEQVVLAYYGMRSERPNSPVPISPTCESVLDRAFDFNIKRAELLKSQGNQPGGSIDPNRLDSPDLRPSLFQALYEKSRYGRSHAFDAGIEYLNKCLNENKSKR